VQFEYRWGAGSADDIRKYAAELVALGPDVILAPGSAVVGPLLQATRAVPIVFISIPDPVGAGYIDSLARPGGNTTGFVTAGRWPLFIAISSSRLRCPIQTTRGLLRTLLRHRRRPALPWT
jgi:hypothetical protein